MLTNLDKYKVLLASKSPRRRELLSDLRIPYDLVSAGGVNECYPPDLDLLQVSQYLAEKKADAFMKILKEDNLLITADTTVVLDREILGKPADHREACDMLRKLSGKEHIVATGVAITTLRKRTSFTSITKVKFAEITDEDIRFYVENYSPLDKAGAYGIQEWIGCIAVEKIDGSFYNVMGLPVHRLYRELKYF